MSRYKIATKTDILRYKIAKEVFGEIEDNDGVRDIPSWEIFEKCLEQHKLIKDLEHRLSNCIEPKYKLNQDVFVIIQKVVRKTNISSIRIFEGYELSYYCKYVDGERMYLELDENEIFLTEAEAKAKLGEELKDG